MIEITERIGDKIRGTETRQVVESFEYSEKLLLQEKIYLENRLAKINSILNIK